MRLDAKALAIAMGVVWGAAVFLVGAGHLLWPGYGAAFLELAASIYPGFHVGGIGSVAVGALYALLDGGVSGLALAWIYNATSPAARSRA